MAKLVSDSVLDAALDKIATATTMTVCSQQPTSFADIATYALASIALTAVDFTKANGDISGRKVTVASKTDTVDTTGTATHIALDDGTTLLYVTTCTSQSITAGNDLTYPSWDVEFADPT